MQNKVDTVVIGRYTPLLMSYDLALKTCSHTHTLSLSVCLSLYAMLLEELAAALVSDFIFGQVERGLDLWLVI